MTLQKTHDIMENELRCVQRASVNGCDRDCGHCELLMDTDEIVQAYGLVIKSLEAWIVCINEIVDFYHKFAKEKDYEKAKVVEDCIGIFAKHFRRI